MSHTLRRLSSFSQHLPPHPLPFSSEELNGADRIRKRIGNDLPKVLDEDFYLARWFRSYDGDMEKIDHYLREYLGNRQAIGLNVDDIVKSMQTLPLTSGTFPYFSVTIPSSEKRSDDVCVFVHRMQGTDLKQILRVLPSSHVSATYFGLQEMYSRAILDLEKQIQKPAALVVILDLEGVRLSDFINPMSACSRLTKLVTKIWQEYFGENVVKMYIIHPPGLLSVMWQIAKWLIDTKTQSRVEFIGEPADLLNCLDANVVPVEYGGKWIDNTGYAEPPETCCNRPLTITAANYFNPKHIWLENGFENSPGLIRESIKPKQTLIVSRMITEENRRLIWQFTTNSDLDFDVLYVNDSKEECVWPLLTVNSLKIQEQGYIDCNQSGEYRLRFANAHSNWFSAYLEYSLASTLTNNNSAKQTP